MKVSYLIKSLAALIAVMCITISCDDETGSIGGNVMPGHDEMEITQNIYSVLSRSVKADSVLGTTSTSYLGKITDPETNATTSCDFLGQFHILENLSFPELKTLVMDHDTIEADSVDIRLYVSNYYGDSLNSMKLGVYELDTANVMKENMIYYSNLDPWKYVNKKPSAIRKEFSFSVINMTLNDSLQNVYSRRRNI